MATTTTRIHTGTDAWLNSSGRHPGDNRLRLKASGGAATQYAYLYLPLGPELRNMTIASATLHIWGVGTGWGSQTLTVERIASRWDVSTLTWANKPDVGGTPASLTMNPSTDPAEWAVDVTSLVADYAAGARWYGMRLKMLGATTERLFRSLNANGVKMPWLEVVWTDAPAAPTDLSPSGSRAVTTSRPVLTWSNENSPERISITAFQAQVDPAANGATPGFDSGIVTTDLAEYDLGNSAYAGLANTASTQWRVRVLDESGVWSAWSDWSMFTRTDMGTVTITTPGSTVAEHTPPFAWTTTFTQVAWRVRVYDAADMSTPIHTTGRKKGDDTGYGIPAKDPVSGQRILVDDRDYIGEVDAWDAVEREATPGEPTYAVASVAFNYNDDPTPSQVTSLVAVQVSGTPYVDLTWSRTTTPDAWTIVADDKVVDSEIPGADLLVSGTSYKYRYKDAKPGAHTFKVKPVVNDATAASPTASATTVPTGLWILGSNDLDVLVGVYDQWSSFSMPDRATTFELPQGHQPVRIVQGKNGLRGDIRGALNTWSGRTVDVWADRLLALKKLDEPVTLYLGYDVIRAVVYDIVVEPRDIGPTRNVSFSFFQVGKIDWLD